MDQTLAIRGHDLHLRNRSVGRTTAQNVWFGSGHCCSDLASCLAVRLVCYARSLGKARTRPPIWISRRP